MPIRIDEIHFHDSVINRVVEVTNVDEMRFEVSYPADWEANQFEPKLIVFTDVLNYVVDEGPFFGAPTILGVTQIEQTTATGHTRIEIQTNSGVRTLSCKSVDLRNV